MVVVLSRVAALSEMVAVLSRAASLPPEEQAGARMPIAAASQVYYRITVRITGPRNTLSYVQAVIAK